MSLKIILMIIITHWVADFYLQISKMALNKSKNTQEGFIWLSNHVIVYTAVFMIVSNIVFMLEDWHKAVSIWVGINGILHFITDYFTSRWTSKLYAKQHWYGMWPIGFFTTIGLDQVIHYVCLFTTMHYFLLYW